MFGISAARAQEYDSPIHAAYTHRSCDDAVDLLELVELRELTLEGARVRDLAALASLPKLRLLRLGPAYPHLDTCSDKDTEEPHARRGDARLTLNLPGVVVEHIHDDRSRGSICDRTPEICTDSCSYVRKEGGWTPAKPR